MACPQDGARITEEGDLLKLRKTKHTNTALQSAMAQRSMSMNASHRSSCLPLSDGGKLLIEHAVVVPPGDFGLAQRNSLRLKVRV